jgi:hypothetical protein
MIAGVLDDLAAAKLRIIPLACGHGFAGQARE